MNPTHTPTNPSEPGAVERLISARLEERIRTAIAEAGGALPFDRFMDLALYAPGLGYYVAGAAKFGLGGDFVTAPELSPLFGRCLAAQCAEVLERLGGGDLLELGAGSGALAEQLLGELERLGALPGRYLILEPSPELQSRQRERLRQSLPALAGRCHWLSELPHDLRGLVVANEVLDAMPVNRFRIGDSGAIEEILVRSTPDGLAETAGPVRSPGLAEHVVRLHAAGLATAAGYSSEVNLRLGPWLNALAGALSAGMLLLLDYGHPRSAYYQPDRHMGTLMCHYRHQAHADPFRHLGLQDMTAHVDFTAVAEAGVASGFTLAGFTTQAHFLLGCGIDRLLAESAGATELLLSTKQLLLPSAMGEVFKSIALTKCISGNWCGFSVRDLSDRL